MKVLCRKLRLTLLILAVFLCRTRDTCAVAVDFSVMSFNLRFNEWDDTRRVLALQRIIQLPVFDPYTDPVVPFDRLDAPPDIIGLQEAKDEHLEFLIPQLASSGYAFHTRGREADGSGENATIFFNANRFHPRSAGHFWLSFPGATHTPGSFHPLQRRSPDDEHPRMASWVILADSQNLDESGNAREYFVINTHWSTNNCAIRGSDGVTGPFPGAPCDDIDRWPGQGDLMRTEIARLAGDLPVIVTGDLNTNEEDDGFLDLTGENQGVNPRERLVRSYRQVHPDLGSNLGPEKTLTGIVGSISLADYLTRRFVHGNLNTGESIDHVLHSANTISTISANIDRAVHITSTDVYFPSDHYPITAVLRYDPKPEITGTQYAIGASDPQQTTDGGTIPVFEGDTVSVTFSAEDPAGSPLLLSINGTGVGLGTSPLTSQPELFTRADQGTIAVVVNAANLISTTDPVSYDRSNDDQWMFSIDFANADPTIDAISGDLDVAPGEEFAFDADASDPGVDDVLVYDWDLDGDGQFDDVLDSKNGTHSFDTPGVYAVELRVSDGDGGEARRSFNVKVGLPGDLNFDGFVNRVDVALLARNFGGPVDAAFINGDLDGDSEVSLGDFAIIQANLGQTGPLPSASQVSVPEPSCLTLLLLGSITAIAAAPPRHRSRHATITWPLIFFGGTIARAFQDARRKFIAVVKTRSVAPRSADSGSQRRIEAVI